MQRAQRGRGLPTPGRAQGGERAEVRVFWGVPLSPQGERPGQQQAGRASCCIPRVYD